MSRSSNSWMDSSTKVLVMEHLAIEPAAVIGDVLEENGILLEHYDTEALAAPSPVDDYAGFVIMGGPMSANDAHLPFIAAELELTRHGLRKGTPMLGICLGAQLLAKAAGGRVHASPVREIGWYPVYPTSEATDDPLFSLLPEQATTIFQWHGETFELPATATLMATNPAVPHQAFRLGRGQYGLQFHVEVDEEIIERWIESGESERAFLGEGGIAAVRNGVATHLEPMQALCRRMVLNWIPLLQHT